MLPLVGYADRLSVAPGETIEFKVSSTADSPYQARLVRVVCGDPNPAGPGIKEVAVPAAFEGRYPSRLQPVHLGSYARVEDGAPLRGLREVTLTATIWPTLPEEGSQAIISKRDPDTGAGVAMVIDAAGGIAAVVGDADGEERIVALGKPLRERAWYRVFAAFDAATGRVTVGQHPLAAAFGVDDEGVLSAELDGPLALDSGAPLLVAALGGAPASHHFNGKIEDPALIGAALAAEEGFAAAAAAGHARTILRLDFSREIPGARVIDAGPNALHGELVNLPTRAVTGSRWTGEEMCWRHAPEQYGAIHFHDDDVYDCDWETDFVFEVPRDLRSGPYAVRLACDDAEDMIPFFVRPPRGIRQSNACVLVPTFTYIVYGNHARGNTDDLYRERAAAWGARPWTPDDHPDYGFSTYNVHRDGSGVGYASRRRPVITMRSGFITFPEPRGGSGLRHFAADTHLFDWLEAKGHDYDVVTDEDLHAEGVDLLAGYSVVMTTSHPEYHTPETLDALCAYTERGGRLMYLGGNGFYWRVAVHSDYEGAVEIRRAEGGIRAWAAEPGEYYQAFDGAYGGLWRRNARPPQQLAGVGFTAQGIFVGGPYRRRPGADDPRAAWIFEGVESEIIGDYGLSGGGAAGFELDRVDYRLGSPRNLVVLASSEGHEEHFILVPEEMLTHLINWPRVPTASLLRADMVYFETPKGGAVFSVGSISFCGSLSHNGYDNDVSRIVDNVLRRFRER